MKRFPLEKNYAALLELYGISAEEVLRRARLPLDLFAHESPSVNADEYYRFMIAIDESVADKELPIRLATTENIEAAPAFRCLLQRKCGGVHKARGAV